tara:strand:+ start:406 stop:732 length:327 start_codon:yes stop_codon:yes gene_type:complete
MSEEEKILLSVKLNDILLQTINEFAIENPQCNLGSASARETLSVFIMAYLSPYIEGYEDEINSLWFMLDELRSSEAALRGPAFNNEVNDMVEAQLAQLRLLQNMKGEA